jgi:transcriptional regulator with XRE-family HTH domain
MWRSTNDATKSEFVAGSAGRHRADLRSFSMVGTGGYLSQPIPGFIGRLFWYLVNIMDPRDAVRRRELGDFVRAQRGKLTPAAAGLTGTARRRTPGLRREEVAQLCGLSATWYTWIEQGRDVSVSSAALVRLATALRLSRAERSYLFELAGRRDPEPSVDDADEIGSAVRVCVDAIDAPAYVLDRNWNARVWNAKAERLFVGWLDATDDRNLLRFIFLEPRARSLIDGWHERARRVVAEFRAQAGSHLNDPAMRDMIEVLREASPDFASLWRQRDVLAREGGERTFHHPRDGFLRFEQVTFSLVSHAEMKLTILVPAPGEAGKPRGERA